MAERPNKNYVESCYLYIFQSLSIKKKIWEYKLVSDACMNNTKDWVTSVKPEN